MVREFRLFAWASGLGPGQTCVPPGPKITSTFCPDLGLPRYGDMLIPPSGMVRNVQIPIKRNICYNTTRTNTLVYSLARV